MNDCAADLTAPDRPAFAQEEIRGGHSSFLAGTRIVVVGENSECPRFLGPKIIL